jgi:hypothetical protein
MTFTAKTAQYASDQPSIAERRKRCFRSVKIAPIMFPIGKKTRGALSGGRYNLKHFVTALLE